MKRQVLAMLLDSAPHNWSSIEELHLQFSRDLLAHGIQPVLVFSQPLREELSVKFTAIGAKVESINYADGICQYYHKLEQLVKHHSVTIVHIAYFNYYDPIAWLVRFCGVHQIIFLEGNSGVLRARGWRKRLIWIRARMATRPITKVIAVSQFIGRQLVEIGVPAQKIRVAYHGVDLQRFSPSQDAKRQWRQCLAIQPDELILTSIAHLRAFKHPEIIVEAFAQLARRGIKARLLMAGGGEMWRPLDELSHRLGVGQRIHWLGNCDNVETVLQASDIFLLASVGEAFGLVLTEAMACGVPVVGSRSGAIPEIVEDGKTGLLAPPLDPDSFADAIERLARDEGLRRRMGLRGLDRVRQHFTIGIAIQRLLDAYDSLLRAGG